MFLESLQLAYDAFADLFSMYFRQKNEVRVLSVLFRLVFLSQNNVAKPVSPDVPYGPEPSTAVLSGDNEVILIATQTKYPFESLSATNGIVSR